MSPAKKLRTAPTFATLAIAALLAAAAPAAAADVTALTLPAGFTVHPEAEHRLVTIAPDGTVAAAAAGSIFASLAVRWDRAGRRSTLPMVKTPPGEMPPFVESLVAAPDGVYATIGQTSGGATITTSFDVERWTGERHPAWEQASCTTGGDPNQHVYAVDALGRVALTADTSDGIIPAETSDGFATAPRAVVVDGRRCRYLGKAVVLNVRGPWASGYRGYLGRAVAPTDLNVIVQRAVAVRWRGETPTELGGGAAYAVNAHGIAVGATAVAGRFEKAYGNFFGPPGAYESAVPHAVGWDAAGRRFAIGGPAERSVAYDVSDDGTIVGMLQALDGEHYAFRERAGTFERLDDLPHPAGWRFESAYAIGADGTIVGIGTRDGRATVFRWRP